jgi:dTDP-4-dehydrorhamnose reductase
MKILVLGGGGQAGTEFRAIAGLSTHQVLAPSRVELDIERAGAAGDWVSAHAPDLVVNLAAFHVLDQCETDFDRALTVNVRAVREMALAARAVGAWFVTVSTDYVFDGRAQSPYREDHPVAPLQAYGISKAAGEFAALAAHPEGTIVARTCGLYGLAGSRTSKGNFVEKRLADAATHDVIEVGSDLKCTPTSAASFARALWGLLSSPSPAPGIYHLTAEGECDWAAFTAAIFQIAGAATRVRPVDRKNDYGVVRRPAYSVLANTRARACGVVLPGWRDDLSAYLAARSLAARQPSEAVGP